MATPCRTAFSRLVMRPPPNSQDGAGCVAGWELRLKPKPETWKEG